MECMNRRYGMKLWETGSTFPVLKMASHRLVNGTKVWIFSRMITTWAFLDEIIPMKRDFKMLVTPRFHSHYEKSSYEDLTSDLLANISFTANLFVDVGANYGYFTLLVARSNSDCKLIAFEPVPENYAVLLKNLDLNHLDRDLAINKAVSNKNGQARFNISTASDNSSFILHPATPILRQIDVQVTTLGDEYLLHALGPILIKIDTEGHEIEVLEGMEKILSNRDDIRLIVEFNTTCLRVAGHNPEDLINKLFKLGYDIDFTVPTPAAPPKKTSRAPTVLQAWPGLEREGHEVNLRLFRTREEAQRASLPGIQRLVELALQKDLAWLEKDLRSLARLEPLLSGFCSVAELQASALEHLKNYLLPQESFPRLSEAHFRAAVEKARGRLPGLAQQLIDRLETTLKPRQELLRRFGPKAAPVSTKKTLTGLDQLGTVTTVAPPKPNLAISELASLLPKNFLESTPFEQLAHFPRYLKALLTRAERAALNPQKDQERARQLSPYVQALRELQAKPQISTTARRDIDEFRWLIEEFKVLSSRRSWGRRRRSRRSDSSVPRQTEKRAWRNVRGFLIYRIVSLSLRMLRRANTALRLTSAFWFVTEEPPWRVVRLGPVAAPCLIHRQIEAEERDVGEHAGLVQRHLDRDCAGGSSCCASVSSTRTRSSAGSMTPPVICHWASWA